jgi:hypothetical protein
MHVKVVGYLSSISNTTSKPFVSRGKREVLIRGIMSDSANYCYRAPIPPSPGRAVNPLSRTC